MTNSNDSYATSNQGANRVDADYHSDFDDDSEDDFDNEREKQALLTSARRDIMSSGSSDSEIQVDAALIGQRYYADAGDDELDP